MSTDPIQQRIDHLLTVAAEAGARGDDESALFYQEQALLLIRGRR